MDDSWETLSHERLRRPGKGRGANLNACGVFWTMLRPQAKKGGLKDTLADDLVATVIKATLERTGVNPEVANASLADSFLPSASLFSPHWPLRSSQAFYL